MFYGWVLFKKSLAIGGYGVDDIALWGICVREHALKLAGRYYINGNNTMLDVEWVEFNIEQVEWDRLKRECPLAWKRVVRDFPHLRAFEILFV